MDMDEVLEKLVCSIIGPDTESPEGYYKKGFEGYYKNWGKLNNQEQRRKEILNVQKLNRNNKVDKFRGILDIINEDNDDEQDSNYHKNIYRPNIYVAGFTKTSLSYKNVLMLSEWMIEKPADFHTNWTVTPCPKGVRSLVVASNGSTKCYSKFGTLRFHCSTALPGGCGGRNSSKCCILDCFYVETKKTMFVLDLLAWNSQPMTDGESEFRYFWLQSQLDEIPELRLLTKTNKLIFKLLPKVSCAKDSFDEFMSTLPHFKNHSPGLDGLLFYHKKAQYVAGQTPLVGWLYPFMVPEVIEDVKIHPAYMFEVPLGYEGQADYISRFEDNLAKKKVKSKSEVEDAMDTTAVAEQKDKYAKKSIKMDTTPAKGMLPDWMIPETIPTYQYQTKMDVNTKANTRNQTSYMNNTGFNLTSNIKNTEFNLTSNIKNTDFNLTSNIKNIGFNQTSNIKNTEVNQKSDINNTNDNAEEEWVFPEFYPANYKKNNEEKAKAEWIPEFVPTSNIIYITENTNQDITLPDATGPSNSSNYSQNLNIGATYPNYASGSSYFNNYFK